MKMFCDKCGRKIEEGERFCIKCGNPLYEEEKQINIETEPEQTEETVPVEKKKKGKGLKVIAIIAAFAIVISGIATLLHTGKLENVISLFVGDSAEKYRNAYNMTEPYMYIARNDKYIFYLRSDDKNGYENIIRMDADFKNRKTVVENEHVGEIYISGNLLYFRDHQERVLFCSDFDGNNIQRVLPMEVEWFAIADDSLFFIGRQSKSKFDAEDELALYKSTLDGARYEKIIEDMSYDDSVLSIEDGCIVYIDEEDMICTADTAGENRKSLFKYDGNARDCKIYKNKFYYLVSDSENENLSGIYCVDMTTGEEQKIISMEYGQESFTFWNDSILYGDGLIDTEIHICALDGSGEKLFCEVPESTIRPFHPVVMGDYLYYIDLAERVSNINLKTLKVEAFEAVGRYSDIEFTDNYIFYIDNRDENIYRCDYDGSNVLKLTDSECSDLYTYKNKLYYIGYANGYDRDNDKTASGKTACGIFCLDEDGEGAYPIVLSNHNLHGVTFYDNYLMYIDMQDIYRVNIDNPGAGKEEVHSQSSLFVINYGSAAFVYKDWIYVNIRSDFAARLVRVGMNGKANQYLVSDDVYNASEHKENIYYLKKSQEGASLFKMDMDGGYATMLFCENIGAYVVCEDIVYFIDGDDCNIYRINLDGTVKTKLTDTACDSIYVHNNRIYYTDVYDHGYVYSMNLDGSDKKVIITENDDYTKKTFYKTEGVDA